MGSGFAAAWQRGNFKPGDPALWATQNASHSEAATSLWWHACRVRD